MGSNAFTPGGAAGNTVALAATASTGSVALPTLDPAYPEIEITNDGPSEVFVVLGGSAVTATVPTSTAGGYPILAGQSKIVRRNGATHIAAICNSGETAAVYATAGQGE
jgi:hypothetical protein